MTTKREVRAQVTRLAKQEYPELPEGAATAQFWNDHPEYREAYERAEEGSLPPRESAPVQKGADILREVEEDAERLMTDPRVLEVMNERGRMAKAKLLAWEKPGRKERYAEALAS